MGRKARSQPLQRRFEPIPGDAPPVFSNHGLRHSGGIERYLLTLVRALHARGIRPVVIAKRFDLALPEYGWVDAVPVAMGPVPGKWRDFWFDWRLRALKRRRGWFPLIALNQTAAADIAICGSTHPGHLEAMGRRGGWLDARKTALEHAHLHNALVVIAHSQLLSGQVQRFHGVPAAKIVVAHPPVDTERFSPVDDAARRELRRRLGFPDDRAVFLLASTGHARKGLDLALAAIGHSPLPVLLAVAGRPVDAQAPNLRYLGYRQDIEDVYRAADATVMASRYEPFGLVGVESVLCGTPVLGAEGIGCLEVLTGEGRIPFRLDDAGGLARAVDQALARWRAGTLRVADPRAALVYDPSPDAHLGLLLDWVRTLRSAASAPD